LWSNLKVTWQKCAELPVKFWTNSVAELDRKVYIDVYTGSARICEPLRYDLDAKTWSILPELPFGTSGYRLVAVPEGKQLLAIGGITDTSVSDKVFLWDEKSNKWLSPYPDMPTARYHCSIVCHGNIVIASGGITAENPLTLTNSVEVLQIGKATQLPYWSVVKPLPFAVASPVSLVVNDRIYVAGGGDDASNKHIVCNTLVTASLPLLLQSSNTSSDQVWSKLPDMPYCSQSINHYQGRLITFTGIRLTEQMDNEKPVYRLVPQIHMYNPNTRSWDCMDNREFPYNLGTSVHIGEHKILFIGGTTGTHVASKDDDLVTSCVMLTFTPR